MSGSPGPNLDTHNEIRIPTSYHPESPQQSRKSPYQDDFYLDIHQGITNKAFFEEQAQVNIEINPITAQGPNNKPFVEEAPLGRVNPFNIDAYPRSHALFAKLCNDFGPANVYATFQPDNTDDFYLKSLKKSNHLIYFMHKSDKYKSNIQKMINIGLCGNGCCYKRYSGNMYKHTEPKFCFWCMDESIFLILIPLIIFYPLFSSSYPIQFRQFYFNNRPSHFKPEDDMPSYDCCLLCGKMIDFRKRFFASLEDGGFDVGCRPNCLCSCIFASCAKPCLAMQYESMIHYYSWKRFQRYENGAYAAIQTDNEFASRTAGAEAFLEFSDLERAISNHNQHCPSTHIRPQLFRQTPNPLLMK